AGRDRRRRCRLSGRVHGAVPLPRASGARRACVAGRRVSRPAVLLAIQVAAVTAILGCLVAVASLHAWRLDLTPERRFTLSPYTRAVLERVEGDVRITTFYSSQGGAIRREMADLLALYR